MPFGLSHALWIGLYLPLLKLALIVRLSNVFLLNNFTHTSHCPRKQNSTEWQAGMCSACWGVSLLRGKSIPHFPSYLESYGRTSYTSWISAWLLPCCHRAASCSLANLCPAIAVSQLLQRLWQAWTCSALTCLRYFLGIKHRGSGCMHTEPQPAVDLCAGMCSLMVSAGPWQVRPVSPEADVTRYTNSSLPLLFFGSSESPLIGLVGIYEFIVFLTVQRWFWELQTMPEKNWQKKNRIELLDNS